jgi:hypothetical protein
MSTITITMPAITESSLKAAFTEYATTSLLPGLAKKYGFDAEEEARALNLDDLKVNKTASKGGKAKKTEGDKPKVKRGPTGYLLFLAHVRPEIKAEMEEALRVQAEESGEAQQKLKPQAVVTEGAKRWRALSKEEQTVWTDKAKAAKTPPSSEGEEEEQVKETKKETKKKSKKDEASSSTDAPAKKKGAANGYLLFGKMKRPEVKAEMEAELAEGEKLKPQAVVTEIAKRWQALSDDERTEWGLQAKTPEASDEEE